MNMQKLTQKSREALQSAQSLAIEYQNQQLDCEHLLAALAGQEDGLIGQLLKKMGVDAAAMADAARTKVGQLPRVSGSGRDPDKVYITGALDAALTQAEQEAAAMKDEYVSV